MTTSPKLDGVAQELFIQLLRETGHARMKVLGLSMLPAILPGDIIRVERGNVAPGDVVVFSRTAHLCAHRLLTTVDGQAITRGDANPGLDPVLSCSEILGRVTSLERSGTVVENLRSRPFISLILRNSQLLRRIFLQIHNQFQKRTEQRTPIADF